MRFQSIHWEVIDKDIYSWCLNENSESYLLIITGFTPYLLLKIPNDASSNDLFSYFTT